MKKILLLLVILLTTVSSSWAQKRSVIPNGGYLFGVAINFSDSTVYISPIQHLADLTYDQKTGFLENRADYSHQLSEFIADNFYVLATSSVFFAHTRKEIDHAYERVMRLYKKTSPAKIHEVSLNDFSYKLVTKAATATDETKKTE
ncbi:hypothetical protein [Alloprevotella tannerae]|uniref:hypothetical protein n=1 Tax=Alloprevotella tannerae TaxID=76122 RepID=UPI003C6F0AA7